jgi:hypothetical protein
MDALRGLGGVTGLAAAICSHEHNGLDPAAKEGDPQSLQEHARVFGPNKYKEVPSKNFFMLCFENIQDPIILLLIFAALVRACCCCSGWSGVLARCRASPHPCAKKQEVLLCCCKKSP